MATQGKEDFDLESLSPPDCMEPPSSDVPPLEEYWGRLLSEDFNCVDGFRCDMGGYGAAVGMMRRCGADVDDEAGD